MKICGRSLVVTADVLLNKALASVSDGFRAAVPELNRNGGVIDMLADLAPVINRNDIKNAVEEIFDLAADTFEPLPGAQRSRIRQLLYRVIDTAPAGQETSLTEELKDEAFFPNADAAIDLAMELGVLIRDLFLRLIQRILEMLLEMAWDAVLAVIEQIENAIAAWVAELDDFLSTVAGILDRLGKEIEDLKKTVTTAANELVEQAVNFLGVLADNNQRSSVRNKGKALIKSGCMYVLDNNIVYQSLPANAQEKVVEELVNAIDAIVNDKITDDLLDALGTISAGVAAFIEDVRDAADEDDVAGALIERLVQRIETAIRSQFGSRINISFSFHAEFEYRATHRHTLGSIPADGFFQPYI